MQDSYTRAVEVVRVIDGDTFLCDVDLGFTVRVRQSCRLVGMNTPESDEPGYAEARDALARLLAAGPVVARSVKADKYAKRFDGVVVAGRVAVNATMIDQGFAVFWNGRGPRPLVPWPRRIKDDLIFADGI